MNTFTLRAFPQVYWASSRAVHSDHNFENLYQNKHFNSLHIYEYAATIKIGTETHQIEPGDLTLIPAGVPYRYDIPLAGSHMFIHFQHSKGMPLRNEYDFPCHLKQAGTRNVVHLAKEVIKFHLLRRTNDLIDELSSASFYRLFLELALQQSEAKEGRRSDSSVGLVASYIDKNLACSLDIQAMCKIAQLSPNYLAKVFKKKFGMSMSQYQLSRRIETARYILTSTNLTVKEIGQRVGIPDAQYFNKQFRKCTGISPTQARRL